MATHDEAGGSMAIRAPSAVGSDENDQSPDGHRELRSGDLVRVRSGSEILATLDADGRLDGLPFMPEMLRYSGQFARVDSRADKACDTIGPGSHRRLHETVHLEGLRCDGQAHGGCQAACLIFWKEAWLERASIAEYNEWVVSSAPAEPDPAALAAADPGTTGIPVGSAASIRTRDDLQGTTQKRGGEEDNEVVYVCQATELLRATVRLPAWDVRQYIRDVRSGNVRLRDVLLGVGRWFFVAIQLRLTGSSVPFVHGRQPAATRDVLGLKAGDRVRVKSRHEIELTLDARNRNRGLTFDSEMLRYCGREMRVRDRVERIIDERTGQMRLITSDCLILEGAVCTSQYHLFCPRKIFPYWRESWLTRIDDAEPETA